LAQTKVAAAAATAARLTGKVPPLARLAWPAWLPPISPVAEDDPARDRGGGSSHDRDGVGTISGRYSSAPSESMDGAGARAARAGPRGGWPQA